MDLVKLFRSVGMQIHPESFRPKFARIIVSRNCALRCQMCTFWRKWKADPTFDEIKHWIDELAKFGVEEISIGGGEPFLRKDLPQIVNRIKSRGIRCGITTSGWFVNSIPLLPADHYEVSIDGVKPETHDKIRGKKGSWEKAVKTVKMAKKKYSVSQINFVLQADNYTELVDYCKFAKSLGVKVSVIPISPKLAAQPAISKKMAKVDPNVLRNMINEAMKIGNITNTPEFFEIYLSKFNKEDCTHQSCLAPYECILIFANSDVYVCGNFDSPVGRLTKKKKLEEIYKNYTDIRKAVSAGKHRPCWNCSYPDIIPHRSIVKNIKFFVREARRKVAPPGTCGQGFGSLT